MLFNTLTFVVFFLLVYGLYLVLGRRWQNRMLLAASYWFYGSWDWRFLSLIWLSTAVDYLCGRRIHASADPRRRRAYLVLSLAVNLGLLGVFKYFGFFAENLRLLLEAFGVRADAPTLRVILPVGISFYTFQTLSYTLDIYRGKLEPERDPVDFALFVAFFPQLVAGPIERASRLLPQIARPRRITAADIREGLWMTAWGYFLKVFVADNLAAVADRVFASGGIPPGGETLLGIYAFAFQIFGDFAGYSSIAIGVSKLMGFDLMTNFRFPYFVTNPRDFWHNWHISLSSWLRDYLYISLGGNRKGTLLLYRNLFLTMALGGLWHGAAWTFVAWGIYQGAILIAHRLLEPVLARFRPPAGPAAWLARGAGILFMFQVTCFGWLLFRAQSMEQIGNLARSVLFHMGEPSPAIRYYGALLLFHALPVLAIQIVQARTGRVREIEAIPPRLRVAVVAALFFLTAIWGEYGAKEFIYFQF